MRLEGGYRAHRAAALAGVACRRRQKKYESPQRTPVAAAQPHASGRKRRAEVDGKAGIGPLLEPRRHRRKQEHHAEELGPRELHPEPGGEAEVGEGLRNLWKSAVARRR